MPPPPPVAIVPLATFRPQAANANLHTSRGEAALRDSLQADGWIDGQTVAADNEHISGSSRLEQAAATGFDEAIVVDSDGTRPVIIRRTDIPTATDPRAQRLGVAANRVAQLNLAWNPPVLAALALDGAGLGTLFKPGELTVALGPGLEGPTETPSEVLAAELGARWGTAPGQLWTVAGGDGRVHRLLCGDSSDPDTARRLLGDATPDIVLTDPPYELPGALVMTTCGLYAARAVVMSAGQQAFSLVGWGWRYCFDLVWRHRAPRSMPIMTQPKHYHVKFVMLLYGQTPDDVPPPDDPADALSTDVHTYLVALVRDRAALGWHRPGASFGSVIEIPGLEYERGAHGHGKSSEVFRRVVRGFRWPLWVDPYVGSGATLLACETEGRTLYGCELDPLMLAACLERVTAAGLTPTLETA